ncbi:hypothetical protein PHLGIDRAFT_130276 [Phlebiopsis gigantea 11061_1 CR5-6]|uniref:DUF6533 domain-containing protein n=1 Tax=Phlebiopsis gigantea (strain 11061_1 CR5-6) TaxID=745531 RepID=A0A0C3S1Q0_PHLG1|nr:hypothetical protein PHLGIDRAFT_130276 [Phlebiopsis gigantea 11061_1 CR5-6]
MSESIQDLWVDFIAIMVTDGATALVLYEYLITFDKEVEYVWKPKKLRTPSALLLAIRWTMVLLVIFYQLPTPSDSCKAMYWITALLTAACFFETACLSAQRTLAMMRMTDKIFSRDIPVYFEWIVPGIVLALGSVPVATNLFNETRYVFSSGCSVSFNETSNEAAMTLVALNSAQIATYNTNGSPASTFIVVMPPILANRFILHLHAANEATTGLNQTTLDDTDMMTLEFMHRDSSKASDDDLVVEEIAREAEV